MTNPESVQASYHAIDTVFKMDTCLTRLATTFFVPQMEKILALNSHYKTLPGKKIGSKDKATMHKNKRLSDYIYSIANFIMLCYNANANQSLFDVYKNW